MIEPVASQNPSPGSLLRHQRQHIGWTVEEVANALCLSADLIRQLEADDYAEMGGSTFILGYLRGYARLVGIDVEEAIVSHRDAIPEYVPDPDQLPETPGARRRPRRPRLRPLLVVVVVLALAAGGYFLWPRDDQGQVRVTDGLTVESTAPGASGGTASYAPPQRLDRMTAIAAGAASEAMRADGELPLNLALADIPAADTADAVATPAQTGEPLAAGDGRRHLVLMFDEGSWADVRDATGERLLSQIVAGGSSVDLVGEPPFTVFLGNAGGVRVKYLGRIQSYSQTEKGLFARFTVGQQP